MFVVLVEDALHSDLFLDTFGYDGFKTERLNTDKRGHCYHGDEPEGIRQNTCFSAHRKANADDEGEDEGRGQRAACNPARVECDCRINLGYKEGQAKRNKVTGDKIIQHAETVDNTDNGKPDRRTHAAGKGNQHRAFANGAARNRFDLFVQDVDSRLRQDDGKAEKEGKENHHPVVVCGDLHAHFKTDGHKTDLYGGKEDDQTEEGVENTDDDLSYLALGRAHKNCLQDKEENNDRAKRNRHVFQGMPKRGEELVQLHCVVGNGVI